MKSVFRQVCLILLVFLVLSGTVWAANYIVSGAPNTDANGLYVQDGIFDDVPKYTKGYWTLERHYDGTEHSWLIFESSGGMVSSGYYNNDPSDLPPNNHQWKFSDEVFDDLTVTLDPSSIPSLGTWGALIMLTLLIGIAIAVIRKRNFGDTGASA